MKTIEIQNCTDNRDYQFKVFVNGEKHTVRYQTIIQVTDNQPIEIKAKYFWGGSPKYTFDPKDNLLLQICVNQASRRLINVSFGLTSVAMVLVIASQWIFGEGLLLYISQALWLIVVIRHFIVIRKKMYTIQELKRE